MKDLILQLTPVDSGLCFHYFTGHKIGKKADLKVKKLCISDNPQKQVQNHKNRILHNVQA